MTRFKALLNTSDSHVTHEFCGHPEAVHVLDGAEHVSHALGGCHAPRPEDDVAGLDAFGGGHYLHAPVICVCYYANTVLNRLVDDGVLWEEREGRGREGGREVRGRERRGEGERERRKREERRRGREEKREVEYIISNRQPLAYITLTACAKSPRNLS